MQRRQLMERLGLTAFLFFLSPWWLRILGIPIDEDKQERDRRSGTRNRVNTGCLACGWWGRSS